MFYALGTFIFFAAILGLFHLWIDFVIRWLSDVRLDFDGLAANGTLFFFSVPFAAGAYGECQMVRLWARHGEFNTFAEAILILIIFLSTVIYTLVQSPLFGRRESTRTSKTVGVIGAEAQPSPNSAATDWDGQDAKSTVKLNERVVCYCSKWIAGASVIYGLVLTALRVSGF